MKKSLFLAGSAFALLVCLACEGAEGIVNAAWLNARVFPELKSPVAVKLYSAKNGKKEYLGRLAGYEDGDVTLEDGLRFRKAEIAQVRLRIE